MRTAANFFVSYAHDDDPLADDLVTRLRAQMKPSAAYDHTLWRDTVILAGELWRRQIEEALDACDLGLLLVSPRFLGSAFIGANELPRFVGSDAKPVIPVMLRPVSFARHDLKGLEDHQIYRLDRRKAYSECTGSRERERFIEELFLQIENRLDRLAAAKKRGARG